MFQLYLKVEGLDSALCDQLGDMSGWMRSTKQMAKVLNLLQDLKVPLRSPDKLHVELIFKVDGRAVLVQYMNRTNFNRWSNGKATDYWQEWWRLLIVAAWSSWLLRWVFYKWVNNYFVFSEIRRLSSLYFEFSINYQSLQFPLIIGYKSASDIGAPVLIQIRSASLISTRGSVSQENEGKARNAELDLRWIYHEYLGSQLSLNIQIWKPARNFYTFNQSIPCHRSHLSVEHGHPDHKSGIFVINLDLCNRYSWNGVTTLKLYDPLQNRWHGADRCRNVHIRLPFATQLVLQMVKSLFKVTAVRHKGVRVFCDSSLGILQFYDRELNVQRIVSDFIKGSRLGMVWHASTRLVSNKPIIKSYPNISDVSWQQIPQLLKCECGFWSSWLMAMEWLITIFMSVASSGVDHGFGRLGC